MANLARAGDVQRTHRARRARDLLRADVAGGRWAEGPLPPERELERMLAASRNVVRDALGMLVEEGMLVRVPGSGTFVLARKELHRFDVLRGIGEPLAGEVTEKTDNATGGGGRGRETTVYRVRTLEVVPAPRRVAESLALAAGDPVILLERLTVHDGERLALWTTYLRYDLTSALLAPEADARRNLYQIVEHLGLSLGTSEVRTEAVVADPAVANILGIPTGHPLLLLSRILCLSDGRPVDVGTGYLRGDRVTLTHRLSRPPRE